MLVVIFFFFSFYFFIFIGMCWFMYLVVFHFRGRVGREWSVVVLLCSARQTDREREREQRRNKNKFVYSMCFAWLLRSRGILYQTSRSPPTLTLPKHKQQEEKKST